jgi:SAM-dependent methyltransferase
VKRVCVNIACGTSYVDGWLNFDYTPASSAVTKANLLGNLPLGDATADVLYSSHFLEHVPRRQVEAFLADCFRVLKPGGQIRLALPDLDELCREYLSRRDAGEHAKADFVVLEMLDQCVRTRSGGELGAFYGSLSRGGAADMIHYVSARTGEELSSLSSDTSAFRLSRIWGVLFHPAGLWARLQQLYCRLVILFLPSAFREQNVSFAPVGERHVWIYDFHSLSKLLEQAGFVSILKCSFNQTEIDEFPLYPLDANREGFPRKGLGSMYVEARKP